MLRNFSLVIKILLSTRSKAFLLKSIKRLRTEPPLSNVSRMQLRVPACDLDLDVDLDLDPQGHGTPLGHAAPQ